MKRFYTCLRVFKITAFIPLALTLSCKSGDNGRVKEPETPMETRSVSAEGNSIDMPQEESPQDTFPVVGANRMERYLHLLEGKTVGVVTNQTGVVFKNPMRMENREDEYVHLIDTLLSRDVDITVVFTPEHGFRGTADAGERIRDGKDGKTGLPLISLYGNNYKPTAKQMQGLDIVLFDLQDVGARFYTYISTLHYMMEACAEAGIPLLLLDRPNPNIHYVDGPILEERYRSFVGMHPVPVVHGLTIGEYGRMINGEKWLAKGEQCDLEVVLVAGYTRGYTYSLPVKPSPNLPNDRAINLYPSLCFFEGTPISVGRGTEMQFQVYGSPELPGAYFPFSFVPRSNEGAKNPKHLGKTCRGEDLREDEPLDKLNLEWLIEAYVASGKPRGFFKPFFTNLAGTKKLQQQVEQGYTYPEIRATWLRDLEAFRKMREPYLLYGNPKSQAQSSKLQAPSSK